MADLGDMASAIETEERMQAIRRARAAVPVGVPGECDACGDDSPRLVGGRCAPCRDGRMRVAFARPAVIERSPIAAPEPAPRRQWIGAAPAAPRQEEVTVAEERTRQVNMRLSGAALATIEAGVEAHGTLGASALALIEAGMGGSVAEPTPGPVDLTAIHIDALIDELRGRFERASDAEALERHAEQLEADKRALTARAEAAEAAHAELRGRVEALLG